MIGQTVKTYTAPAKALKQHTVESVIGGIVHFTDGGSIPLANLCQCGSFWLECAPPDVKKPVTPKVAIRRLRKALPQTMDVDGEIYGNVPYCMPFLRGKSHYSLYTWASSGWVKALVNGYRFFLVSDVVRVREWRETSGRIVHGDQFYTPVDIAKRTGEKVSTIRGWGKRGRVEEHHPVGSIIVMSWPDTKVHLKYLGRPYKGED